MKQNIKDLLFSKQHGKAEIIAFFCYIAGISFVGYFHEPWFDEAQAWQIARCATLKEILFTIPHYEGHPQLWHLLLMPFARAGAPFELTIFLVNAAFCVSAVGLILWKSPFPKIVRCWIPFTFFYFYQYGVLSRPYSMMMLAFCFAALAYPKRDQKPVWYILALSFLCMTSAYGVVIAGGLCLVWVFEILKEYRCTRAWRKVVSDKRPYALCGILILAVFLLLCMLPAEDCFFDQHDAKIIQKIKLLRYLFILPFDSFIGCYLNDNTVYDTSAGLVIEIIGGIVFWVILLLFLHENRKKALFLVPYLMYGITMLLLFFATHHLGISALFMIFILWVIYAENGTLRIPPVFLRLSAEIRSNGVRLFAKLVMVLAALVSPLCSVVSSVNEIRYTYGLSCVAYFIREHQLADKNIMVMWNYEFKQLETESLLGGILFDETLPADCPPIAKHHPYLNGVAVAILPYFEENIIMNFNADDPDCLYMKWIDGGDHEKLYQMWQQKGLPDVIFGLVPLQEIYTPEQLDGVTYDWVDTLEYGNIWKLTRMESEIKVYIRSDLLDEYPQFEKQTFAQKAKEPD